MTNDEQSRTRRGLVISDLHLYALRSRGWDCLRSLCDGVGSVDILVLNGDIFDFRWSTLDSTETTISAAMQWLSALLELYADMKVIYVLGNHDCLPEFERRLRSLSQAEPRLEVHPYFALVGDALFLHGDCANGWLNGEGLGRYRARWQREERFGRLAARTYRYADKLGGTRLVHWASYPQGRTVKRVSHYLDDVLPEWRGKVRHCYFGHTHRPFAGFEKGGVTFHNTGSASGGMEFLPIFFDVTEPAG